MCSLIRQKRTQAGISLRQLSGAMGQAGFSLGRLSLVERGLARMSAHDEAAIIKTIDLLAPLSKSRQLILKAARGMDFATDVREARLAEAR